MRLWTVHPRYLDTRGLVALWRNAYLLAGPEEAARRGHAFDRSKIRRCDCEPILVTRGQLDYEWQRLLAKQRLRDPAFYRANMQVRPRAHPLFRITSGPIASWERS